MAEPRTVHLLGFAARVDREVEAGVVYLWIDDTTALGRVRQAHAAFEEKLATQEAFAGDVAPGRPLRVKGLMHDVDRHVLRVKVEVEVEVEVE